MRDAINLYSIFVRKHKAGKPLATTRRRYANNIKMYIKERRCYNVKQSLLAQARVQWRIVLNAEIFKFRKSGNFLTS
jgi:hypothetical protein